jgi:hypothetical protein
MTSSGLREYSQDVGGQNDMSLAIEKLLAPRTGHPTRPIGEEAGQKLNIAVVFTSVESTLAALKEAGNLANSLGAKITLVVPQVVPYPLPLETPPVLLEFNEHRFRVIASESLVETSVQIYLCRDRLDMLLRVLSPNSLVVVGGRKKWWPTGEKLMSRRLRQAGHKVVLIERE